MAAAEAWAALERYAWAAACAEFEAVLAHDETPELLEGYSWAVWWANRAEATLEARQRAYAAYRRRSDDRGAARMAMWLAADVIDFRCDTAVSKGWLRRARRCLSGVELGPEHGWLALHEGTLALDLDGDARLARERGARCAEVGRTTGDIDVEMLGLALQGLAAVHLGDPGDGLCQLDEAATAAIAGDLRAPVAVGWACCSLIKACESVRDYDRAAQWAEQMTALAAQLGFEPWVRICRSFHAWVLVSRGRWDEASDALVAARERLAVTRPPWTVEAVVRLAELRRRQGRLDEATELFSSAEPDPRAQVGLGWVRLDLGDLAGAAGAARRALRAVSARGGVLTVDGLAATELLIETLVAGGDLGEAAAALARLEAAAANLGTDPVRGSAAFHAGLVARGGGDLDGATCHFEDARDVFVRCRAPYDAALAQLELVRCLASRREWQAADRELTAARAALEQLGAATAVERAGDLGRQLASAARARAARRSSGGVLTAREQEVLGLVGDGLSDREIAARLVLSEHTVHRHVANILRKLDVRSRAAAVGRAARDDLG